MRMDPRQLIQQAHVAHQTGRFDHAEALCQQLLSLNKRDLGAMMLLGVVLAKLGQMEEAIPWLRQVSQADPKNFIVLNWLGMIHRELGQSDAAVQFGERAVKLKSDDPDIVSNLGLAYFETRHYANAVECFRRAIKLRPNHSHYYLNLGIALRQTGHDQEALNAITKAVDLEPSVLGWTKVADLNLTLGATKAAIEAANEGLKIAPDSAELHLLMGQAYSELGQDDQSNVHFERAATLDPGCEAVHIQRALSLQSQGKFDEAAEQFEKALEIKPVQGFAYYGLASGKKLSETDRAFIARMIQVSASNDLDPDESAQLHYALGKAYDNLGEYELALHEFDQANEIVYQNHLSNRPFDQLRFSQQIDAAIAIFTREFFDQNRSTANESDRPVFIVGMLRSGTTLTEQILSSHPNIAGAGELPFWMANEHSLVDYAARKVKDHKVRYAANQYLEQLLAFDSDARRVTDKNPANVLALGLIHMAYPNARIIHTKRHPIDTFLSIYMTPLRTPPEFACNRENIVFAYDQYLRLMEHWRTVVPPDRLFEVSYEDLVADRERVTRSMIDFLELPWSDDCLRPDQNQRTVKTPSFWQVRQPVYSSSVDRWRRYRPWLGAFAKYAQD